MDDDSVGEEEQETNTTAGGGARNANEDNGKLTKYDEEGNALVSIGCYTGTRCVGAGISFSLSVCASVHVRAHIKGNVCRGGAFFPLLAICHQSPQLPSVASYSLSVYKDLLFWECVPRSFFFPVGNPLPSVASSAICGLILTQCVCVCMSKRERVCVYVQGYFFVFLCVDLHMR